MAARADDTLQPEAARSPGAEALEAALTAVLLPALARDGFARFGRHNLGRVGDGILQFVNVQAAAFGARRFCINYAALPLFRPHDFMLLNLGDRLQHAQGDDAWWRADGNDAARTSMRAALRVLRAQALPWFERTRTLAGLLACLSPPEDQAARWGGSAAREPAPDDLFDRACCLARLGRLRESAQAAARARRLYLRDGRAAWSEPAECCAELFAAAQAGEVGPLLDEWQRRTVRTLRLQPLLDGAALPHE